MYVSIENDAKEGTLPVETVEEVNTLIYIFRNNSDLCENISEALIAHVVGLIEHKQRNAVFLEFLQVIVSSCEKETDGTQMKVVEEIGKASDDVRQFYVDSASFELLVEMMKQAKDSCLDATHPLKYHLELVGLMAKCTKGKNGVTELKCASFLPMDHVVRVVTSPHAIIDVKIVYLQFMLHCYIDTDIELKDASNAEYIEAIMDNILEDIKRLNAMLMVDAKRSAILTTLETYICHTVTEVLVKFFEKPYSTQPMIDIKQHQKRFTNIVKSMFELENGPLKLSKNYVASAKNWYRVAECVKRLKKCADELGITSYSTMQMPPLSSATNARQRWQSAAFSARFISRNQQQVSNTRANRTLALPRSRMNDSSNVVMFYHTLVTEFKIFLQPLQVAEGSVLVDILHFPERLFPPGSALREQCEHGGVVSKLIQHCKLLLVNKQENLCVRVLQTLYKMATSAKHQFTSPQDNYDSEVVFDHDLKPLKHVSLYEVQCKLNNAGAVDLVIDLIVMEPSYEVFQKACHLAKALLIDGNDEVQTSFHNRLTQKKVSGKFFRAFILKLQAAQNRIKSDMMSGTNNKIRPASTLMTPSTNPESSFLLEPHQPHLTRQSTRGSIHEGSIGDFPQLYTSSVPDISNYQEEEKRDLLPAEVSIVEPVLRFMQLLCENHNTTLQNFLRTQGGRPDYNLVAETLMFLDTVCGSTKGSLGVFGEIGEHNFSLIKQALITLAEFCQGPCHDNQNTLAMHESNGLDIIISLVLNEIRPLADDHMELALEIKSNASKLLLAIMESRHDSENAERVLRNMSHTSGGPKQLIKAITQAYEMSNSQDFQVTRFRAQLLAQHTTNIANSRPAIPEIAIQNHRPTHPPQPTNPPAIVDPKEVGHNIYILAHQLSRHNSELAKLLNPEATKNSATKEALSFYKEHTAQIEIVRADRKLERVVFPIHEVCSYLTEATKQNVLNNTERDAQGSKVTDFFDKWKYLYDEMKWQRKLQDRLWLSACTKQLRFWGRMSFLYAILINGIIAFFYPFDASTFSELNPSNPFVYTLTLAPLFYLYMNWNDRTFSDMSKSSILAIFALMLASTLLLIAFVGILPTLYIFGVLQLANKTIHLVSYIGNKGLIDRCWSERIEDTSVWYLVAYLFCCIFGLFVHPFFYSLLLFDIIASEETLRNVIRSVTRNWQSIILTGLLALILVYHFSILGYLFFQKDFKLEVDKAKETQRFDHLEAAISKASGILDEIRHNTQQQFCTSEDDCSQVDPLLKAEESAVEEEEEEDKEEVASCDTLRMCIVTTLNWGLRNGGGIGDVLRNVHPDESHFLWRILYDLSFFVVLIIIVLNLVFGVIIDTFGDLRTEKNEKEDVLKNNCFICGLERGRFDNKSVTFEEHNENEHHLWHYLYFIVWLQVKDETEFTGPESYVAKCIKDRNLDWFPRMQAISLQEEDTDNDQTEISHLREQLHQSMQTINDLSRRVQDLQQVLTETNFY
uniref:Inositol 1,4,5-trisphosphate receptor n=1 Tax=Acrobeloides nanus TaxID=290746 RepID=A0A914ER69_9BILA